MGAETSRTAKAISLAIEGISDFFFTLSQIILILLTALVFVSSMLRFALNLPVESSIEIGEYALVFIVFMGAAGIMRREEHITVDIFLTRLKGQRRRRADLAILGASLFWCAMMDWYSWKYVWNAYKYGMTSSSLLRFPLYISYSFLAIGFAVLTLQLLILFSRKLKPGIPTVGLKVKT